MKYSIDVIVLFTVNPSSMLDQLISIYITSANTLLVCTKVPELQVEIYNLTTKEVIGRDADIKNQTLSSSSNCF